MSMNYSYQLSMRAIIVITMIIKIQNIIAAMFRVTEQTPNNFASTLSPFRWALRAYMAKNQWKNIIEEYNTHHDGTYKSRYGA